MREAKEAIAIDRKRQKNTRKVIRVWEDSK